MKSPPTEKPGPAFVGDQIQHPTRKTLAAAEGGSKKRRFYKPLPKEFRRDGFAFRQIAREGNAAIYEQRWTGCAEPSVCYEVIRIRRRDGFHIGDKFFSRAEVYPNSGSLGRGRLHAHRQRRSVRKASGDLSGDHSSTNTRQAVNLTQIMATELRLPAKVTRQPPVTIDTLLTKDEFVRLVAHMANDNPISHFLVAWTDDDGKPQYSKADPHRRADVHAGWTYDTITGKAKRKTSMGLYPKNKANESTWGALDFDAHERGQDELAKNRAIRAFTLMLEYRDRYLILSASGRGYHVFILANEPRPVAEWTHLLKDTCESIDAPIQDGVCEMFPNDRTANQEVGRAIRVPGSLNPSTGEIELILADTIRPLLDHLERQAKALKSATLTSNSLGPRELVRDKEVNNYSYQHKGGFASVSTQRLIDEVLAKYPITKRGHGTGSW